MIEYSQHRNERMMKWTNEGVKIGSLETAEGHFGGKKKLSRKTVPLRFRGSRERGQEGSSSRNDFEAGIRLLLRNPSWLRALCKSSNVAEGLTHLLMSRVISARAFSLRPTRRSLRQTECYDSCSYDISRSGLRRNCRTDIKILRRKKIKFTEFKVQTGSTRHSSRFSPHIPHSFQCSLNLIVGIRDLFVGDEMSVSF